MLPYFDQVIAPAISRDPANVHIDDVFWGDAGATFYWGGLARPKSRLLGMGAADVTLAERAMSAADCAETVRKVARLDRGAAAAPGSTLISGAAAAPRSGDGPLRLDRLTADE